MGKEEGRGDGSDEQAMMIRPGQRPRYLRRSQEASRSAIQMMTMRLANDRGEEEEDIPPPLHFSMYCSQHLFLPRNNALQYVKDELKCTESEEEKHLVCSLTRLSGTQESFGAVQIPISSFLVLISSLCREDVQFKLSIFVAKHESAIHFELLSLSNQLRAAESTFMRLSVCNEMCSGW